MMTYLGKEPSDVIKNSRWRKTFQKNYRRKIWTYFSEDGLPQLEIWLSYNDDVRPLQGSLHVINNSGWWETYVATTAGSSWDLEELLSPSKVDNRVADFSYNSKINHIWWRSLKDYWSSKAEGPLKLMIKIDDYLNLQSRSCWSWWGTRSECHVSPSLQGFLCQHVNVNFQKLRLF